MDSQCSFCELLQRRSRKRRLVGLSEALTSLLVYSSHKRRDVGAVCSRDISFQSIPETGDADSHRLNSHCDQLTYLGPRAVIGSLSLGVAREFRVRKIVARDDDDGEQKGNKGIQRADAEGQIAIHLPHNSLLVMHAEM